MKDLQDEALVDRQLAAAVFEAVRCGNVNDFLSLAGYLSNASIDGWRLAFRKISKLEAVSSKIRSAFSLVWVENKSLRRLVDDDFVMISALRILLPTYVGDALVLYRGESASANRRYGLSWTDDLKVAERFATDARQNGKGGSVLLEVDAPATAIIGTTMSIGDRYHEREYFVDRRLLRNVRILKRFPQLVDSSHTVSLTEDEARKLLGFKGPAF